MGSNYVDIPSTVQVIGCIYNNPELLDQEDKYNFSENDFPDEFHKVIFGTIYNLHALNAGKINTSTVEDYLSQRPTKQAIYQTRNGAKFLDTIEAETTIAAFDYYYDRLKKMTLLRTYSDFGMNLSWLYNTNNILNMKEKQAQEDWFDGTTIEEMADIIDGKIQEIRSRCVDNCSEGSTQIGEGIIEYLNKLEESPDIGYPLYGPLINTITRGARLKKFYLRSAPTNVGKTRMMMADACNLACNEIYDDVTSQWIENGTKEPVYFISTEMELNEVQNMALAFLSNVDSDHISRNSYFPGEIERVKRAAEILIDSPLYTEVLPNFSLKDIETSIKRNIREHNCTYIFFDYLHTSIKILEEISRRSGGVKLREDNILFMISTTLKDICTQYGVFILTSTQLNGDYKDAKIPDQNLLRGAKAIADKIDFGCILLDVTQEDIDSLQPVLSSKGFQTPNLKLSIYKNRGPYKSMYLWLVANRGTCRYKAAFATKYNYELVDIDETKIIVEGRQ